ncbi:MAG: hypothetical protein ACKVTZ_15075 [Bacteroidia bacterium]
MQNFFFFGWIFMCFQFTAFSQGLITKNLYFNANKADLTLESVVKLHKLADTLVNYPTYRITIAAHSDKDPKSPAYRLAQARVKMVEDYLNLLMIRPYEQRAFYDNTALPVYPNESDASGICRKNRIDVWVQYTTPQPPKPVAVPTPAPTNSNTEMTPKSADLPVPAATKVEDSLPALDSRGEEVKGPMGKPADTKKETQK